MVRFLFELSERENAAAQLREFHVLCAAIASSFAKNGGQLMTQFIEQLQTLSEGKRAAEQDLRQNRRMVADQLFLMGASRK